MLLYIKYSTLPQIPAKNLVSFLIQIKPKHKCLSELFTQTCFLIISPLLMQPIIPSVPQNIFCMAVDEAWLPRRSRTWEGSWCRCSASELRVTEQGCSGLLFLAEVFFLYGTGGGWQELDCKSWCHSPLCQSYIYTCTGILCQMLGINSCWLLAIVAPLQWSPFSKYQVKLQYRVKQTIFQICCSLPL